MTSETTSLIAVVLLVVALLLVVRTRSYRECFRSQGVGKLRTKPVPEENGEKNSDQVKTVFIWRDKLIMFWIFFFTLILYRLVCFVAMASCAQGHAVSEWLDEWVKGEWASMLTVGLTPSENGDIRHEIETYLTTISHHTHHKDRNTVTINMLWTTVFISRFGHIGRATSQ